MSEFCARDTKGLALLLRLPLLARQKAEAIAEPEVARLAPKK
jgi:hypothetical protein